MTFWLSSIYFLRISLRLLKNFIITFYEGIADNTFSQNNALESDNLVINKEETFRERLPLSVFFTSNFTLISKVVKTI